MRVAGPVFAAGPGSVAEGCNDDPAFCEKNVFDRQRRRVATRSARGLGVGVSVSGSVAFIEHDCRKEVRSHLRSRHDDRGIEGRVSGDDAAASRKVVCSSGWNRTIEVALFVLMLVGISK